VGRPLISIEIIVTLLKVEPKIIPAIIGMTGKDFGFQLKRKGMDSKDWLPRLQRCNCECVDFTNITVGHCVATNRNTTSMYHKCTSGPAVSHIVFIGVT